MEESGGAAATTTTTTDAGKIEDAAGATMKVKVSYGSNNYDVFIPPQSTFAGLKRVIAEATGLEPERQTVLFRGKEKDDHEHLHMVGVKDNAKVVVTENATAKDEDLGKVEEAMENSEDLGKAEEAMERSEVISRGSEAVGRVREEVDQLEEQVVSLEAVVCSGTQVADMDFIFLTEMLMRQLLKLDGIDAEGEGRVQRKMVVQRVQTLVEKMDNLKEKNSNLSSNVDNSGSVAAAQTEGTIAEPSLTSATETAQE